MVLVGLGAVFCLFVATLGGLIGSVLLRAAVAVANRFLGPSAPPDPFGSWDDWDSDEPAPVVKPAPTRVIPEPEVATGGLIVFALAGASVVGYVVLAFAVGMVWRFTPSDEGAFIVLTFLLGLPFTGLVLSFLLTTLLPTTFERAALVALLFHVFGIVGTGVVGAVMAGVLFILFG